MWDLNVFQVIAALVLDLLLGDPRWMPHQARFAGFLAKFLERPCVAILGRTVAAGWLFVGLIAGGLLVLFYAVLVVLPGPLEPFLETFVFYQAFAAMDLHRHVRAIDRPLRDGNLKEARKALAKIVGRDTKGLDETGISRGAVESVGESACDGLIAPLFWGAILGPAGALFYRVINTLDSLVGHRGPRYEHLGRPAARLDDILNWFPARIVAVLSETFREFRSFRRIVREARRHRSPNAGWGEAAIAYALGVRLGGTNFYGGEPLVGPVFNEGGAAPGAKTVKNSLHWFWKVAAFGFLLLILTSFNG